MYHVAIAMERGHGVLQNALCYKCYCSFAWTECNPQRKNCFLIFKPQTIKIKLILDYKCKKLIPVCFQSQTILHNTECILISSTKFWVEVKIKMFLECWKQFLSSLVLTLT